MFALPDLPYGYDALEPAMSADTLMFHHDKHHRTYIEKTNELAKKAGLTDLSLEELVVAARDKQEPKLFNNAAQAWNHAFFWESMTPDAAKPDGAIKDAIADAFGDLAALKQTFVDEGFNHFGSGWVWLTAGRDGKLAVSTTHDAENFLGKAGAAPLLVCDLWEHAYYLDRKNDRKAYLEAWFDKLANWDFAGRQLHNAVADREGYRFPESVAAD